MDQDRRFKIVDLTVTLFIVNFEVFFDKLNDLVGELASKKRLRDVLIYIVKLKH